MGGHFGAEVVDDEKVAGKIFARGIGAFGAAGKFCGFKVRKEMDGGVVDDGIAAVGDGTRDAGGKEGLSEAGGADHQDGAALRGEGAGIVKGVVVDVLHKRPG